MAAVHAADPELADLVKRALTLDKYAVSRLIAVFEDRRASASRRRSAVLAELDAQRGDRPSSGAVSRESANSGSVNSAVIGITGTPGSGKSSLLSRLTVDLLDSDPDLSIAVVAVDPSSQVSGGALLGDRTRMRFVPDERRLFFRSQASDNDLGGLGPASFQVCRLLTRIFDCVFIETVGIGQSEADIRQLADRVYLVLQPLGGDEVQFLKAGIIEVPDAFVLNKSDEPASDISYHQLQGSMWLARPFDEEFPPVFRTSAVTGDGLAELEADMLNAVNEPSGLGLQDREPYFLRRWVEDEWGRNGVAFLTDDLGGAREFLDSAGGFDEALDRFGERFRGHLR